MTGPFSITPGAVVRAPNNKPHMVRKFENATTVSARCLETGIDSVFKVVELKPLEEMNLPKTDLTLIDEEKFELALKRFKILESLASRKYTKVSDIDEAAQQMQCSRPTVYRLLKRYRQSKVVTGLLRRRRADAGEPRLSEKAERTVKDVIKKYWLTNQRPSIRKTWKELCRYCERERIDPPSYNTLRNRIMSVDPVESARRREGENAALRHKPNEGTVPHATYPYALLQIDHTRLDVVLVDDEQRLPIGRPWITVAIDVYSRMIAGYYVSLDPPGSLGTGICIANAILPKDSTLVRLGLDVPWPCMGTPLIIHADNAKEFRGKMLTRACKEYGIDLIFRPVKKPHYGGHIESLMGTLAEELRTMPGATFSNPKDKGEYDSDAKSAMTFLALEKWLGNLFLGSYHHGRHSALGRAPVVQYTKGLTGTNDEPMVGKIEMVYDEVRLRIDFLPLITRSIQPYGVSIDGIEYFADVLRKWVKAEDPEKRKGTIGEICDLIRLLAEQAIQTGAEKITEESFDPKNLSKLRWRRPSMRSQES